MSIETWFNAMQLGRQHRLQNEQYARENQLRKLTGMAYASQDPNEQRALVAKAAGTDPAAGAQLQEGLNADQDRQRTTLVNMARLLTQTPREGRAGLYERIRPDLAQLGITNVPATYDENPQLIDQTAQGIVSSAMGTQQQSLTPSLQSLMWQRNNGYLDENQFRTALDVLNRTEAAAVAPGYSPVDRWNPETQQMERVLIQTKGYNPGASGYAPEPPQGRPQPMQPGRPSSIQITPTGEAQMPNDPALMQRIIQGINSGQPFDIADNGGRQPPQAASPNVVGPSAPSAREQAEIDAERARLVRAAEAEAALTSEAQASAPQARQRLSSVRAQAQSIFKEIDDALPMIDSATTGVFGAAARRVAGTPAYDLNTKLTTIKANLGFDRLQQMRDESPTGGALGQVAVQELEGLQATIASLDPNMSPPQLKENLMKVRGHYERWADATSRAIREQIDRGERPPVEGARKAGDGNWYVERNGQYFKVEAE